MIVPAAFLAFALQYANQSDWLNWRTGAILAIEPVITLALLWTDEYHDLFFAGKRVGTSSAILDGGPWFWMHVIYSYSLIVLAVVILVRFYIKIPSPYWGQARMIVGGALFPLLGTSIGLLGLPGLPNLDLTPFGFTLTGLAFAYALFYYHLLDLIPVARDALVEKMSDGFLVLDAKERVVDINPAAQKLLDLDGTKPIGQEIGQLLSDMPEMTARYRDVKEGKDEIQVMGDSPQYFDLRISSLYGREGDFTGRLIVLREITERKEAEITLLKVNEILQAQIVEIETLQEKLREQATRDYLTGLFNRRYLQETLERELSVAKRENGHLSLIPMDIDKFKSFDDVYGHKAGDLMLQAIGDLLRRYTRLGDIACRYGGEEFVLVFPGTTLADATRRAEQLCSQFAALRVPYNEILLHTTLSVGVASFPIHGLLDDEILYAADDALYAAKAAGRNCVRAYKPLAGNPS